MITHATKETEGFIVQSSSGAVTFQYLGSPLCLNMSQSSLSRCHGVASRQALVTLCRRCASWSPSPLDIDRCCHLGPRLSRQQGTGLSRGDRRGTSQVRPTRSRPNHWSSRHGMLTMRNPLFVRPHVTGAFAFRASTCDRSTCRRGTSAARFDFSGNGESGGTFQFANYSQQVEELRAVAEHLKGRGMRVTGVVGHSMGGNIVLLYAAKYQDVSKVVNIAGRFHMKASSCCGRYPCGVSVVSRICWRVPSRRCTPGWISCYARSTRCGNRELGQACCVLTAGRRCGAVGTGGDR